MTLNRMLKKAGGTKTPTSISREVNDMLGLIMQKNKFFSHIYPQADGEPSYAVASDAAIKKFRASSFPKKVISLFTGGGGLDIGLEAVGFEVAACVDINKPSWQTIAANTNWPIYKDNDGDLFNITTDALLKFAKLERGEAALVVGGAPCQPFSNMGKKLGAQSHDGRLFREFVRIVDEARPRGFIFENVQGMSQSKHHEVFNYFQKVFERCGYTLCTSVLNSADYGVPQLRKRLFVLGVRGVSSVHIPLMTHSNDTTLTTKGSQLIYPDLPWSIEEHVSVGEAFRAIPKLRFKQPDCLRMNVGDTIKDRMALIKQGENFHVLPMNMRPRCWKNGKHQGADTFGRLRLDMPSVTIRTAAYNPTKGRYIHPRENRGLNTVEMAALQGFPSHWKFHGPLVAVGRQIGNAVPPPLAEHIGTIMAAHLVQSIEGFDGSTKQLRSRPELPADAVPA